ncbi:DUF397 domain-containing protein [Streptomyces katsurahamanus]|uniref:DUF397 domain-containing protein n=1 Tax=Streptomyces katsurahamanus TaxID=2577098 RepID=A0ABW9NXF4_9ACTN|nr:DUF397 domain-containing protein [Streptomyces katsurahamanus]MQS37945.1 DUF397 domain-containing protein [Streptomyces katsurahamanus]
MAHRIPAVPGDAWFKSSYSGAGTSECIETALFDGGAAVRDSKNPLGSRLVFSAGAWAGFVAAVADERLGRR